MENSNMTPELLRELAFSREELAELDRAKTMPIVFDDDCPETTPERAIRFRRVNPPRSAGHVAAG